MDEPAQESLVADNLDVVLDAGPVGDAIQQRRNVANIADGLEFLVPVEFFEQSNHVDRPCRFGQIHHAYVDTAMGIEREILGFEMFGSLVVGEIVQQDSAENGSFGLNISRQAVREIV